MDRLQKQKDTFITLALQLNYKDLTKLKPLVTTMHYKIDMYMQMPDEVILDSLYLLLCDGISLIKGKLVYKELEEKLSKIVDEE
uniref:Uncharacterized protein n=1 Tax=Agrotis segetum granulosis virus TaxID=10464 RepID=A0A023MIK3_GVAS|nr:hypothetical protein AsGV040 [Agrotis segetum granulovirus]